jgi:integrase
MAHITQQLVDKMVTGKPSTKIIWDDEVHGFGVRRNEDRTASYLLDYYIEDKRHRYKIGKSTDMTADAARRDAGEYRGKIYSRDKIDPFAQRDAWKGEPIFEKLANAWLEEASERKRESSLRDDRRMLKKIILPAFGEKRFGEITERHVAQLHKSLRPKKYAANRVLSLVKTVFNYGIHEKLCTANPAKDIKKFPEEKHERWLTVEEIQKFREALDKHGAQSAAHRSAADALKLLMLTGAREGEVLKAEWGEFDLTRGTWVKPSHHTKGRKPEHVPLSPPARKLLEGMYYEGARGPLFPGAKRKGKGGKLTGGDKRISLRRPWIAVCKAAGLVEEYLIDGKRTGNDGEPVKLTRYRPTVRLHDLRHSYASHLVSSGVGLQIIGRLLGHTQPQTTARYAHVADKALRDATNEFGDIFEQAPKTEKRSA